MRQKEILTQGVGRKFITIDVMNDVICINVYNMKYSLDDYLRENLKEREKIESFIDMYVAYTTKRKLIKWIYE